MKYTLLLLFVFGKTYGQKDSICAIRGHISSGLVHSTLMAPYEYSVDSPNVTYKIRVDPNVYTSICKRCGKDVSSNRKIDTQVVWKRDTTPKQKIDTTKAPLRLSWEEMESPWRPDSTWFKEYSFGVMSPGGDHWRILLNLKDSSIHIYGDTLFLIKQMMLHNSKELDETRTERFEAWDFFKLTADFINQLPPLYKTEKGNCKWPKLDEFLTKKGFTKTKGKKPPCEEPPTPVNHVIFHKQ
jgi:hypothetical protein